MYFSDFDWSSETFLIADSFKESASLMKRIIDKTGGEVIVAENGVEALSHLLTNDAITIAIIDDILPMEDGSKVIEKACKLRPDIKFFLCITNPYGKYESIDCISKIQTFQKPISPKNLAYKIEQSIKERLANKQAGNKL